MDLLVRFVLGVVEHHHVMVLPLAVEEGRLGALVCFLLGDELLSQSPLLFGRGLELFIRGCLGELSGIAGAIKDELVLPDLDCDG